ncbi:hypothetical protein [Derxia lacustris]|nr:hypothetical protein [Derxia lacustris]
MDRVLGYDGPVAQELDGSDVSKFAGLVISNSGVYLAGLRIFSAKS